MDKDIKEKWVKALRSGEYTQGNMYLRTECGQHCCLGVLLEVQGCKDIPTHATEELPAGYEAGLSTDICLTLANKNDRGVSFAEIADYIEANL